MKKRKKMNEISHSAIQFQPFPKVSFPFKYFIQEKLGRTSEGDRKTETKSDKVCVFELE